jgi:peroxiredoxin
LRNEQHEGLKWLSSAIQRTHSVLAQASAAFGQMKTRTLGRPSARHIPDRVHLVAQLVGGAAMMAGIAEAIQPGMPAPGAQLHDSAGAQIALEHCWSERPALIFFLRHFGCALCREHLQRIRDAYPAIRARGGGAVVVAFAEPHGAARFGQMNKLPFPILADPTRQAYHAFGLDDGHIAEAFDPAALLRQAAQALRGNIPYVTSLTSAGQRGGVFIVDRSGIVRFAHIATPIYNYPAIERYIAVFDALGTP